MLTRRLALRRETLTVLSPEDMAFVAGGAALPVPDHTLEVGCWIAFSPSVTAPTNCCEGIPTFHGAAC